jgi:hypothetical protein
MATPRLVESVARLLRVMPRNPDAIEVDAALREDIAVTGTQKHVPVTNATKDDGVPVTGKECPVCKARREVEKLKKKRLRAADRAKQKA